MGFQHRRLFRPSSSVAGGDDVGHVVSRIRFPLCLLLNLIEWDIWHQLHQDWWFRIEWTALSSCYKWLRCVDCWWGCRVPEKSALFALAPVGFRHSDRWALILLSSGVCPIEAKWNGRKKCCCLRGLESNVIVVIVAPIIKRKKCHGRLVVGNTDDPRVVHRFMMCNCRAVRNNLWSFSPSFLHSFRFFFRSLPHLLIPFQVLFGQLESKKILAKCLLFCVFVGDVIRYGSQGECRSGSTRAKVWKRSQEDEGVGSKKINGKQRYRTTSDRSDCSATADTGKMYSAGEWCLPIFFALKKQFDIPWGCGSDPSVFVTPSSYIFISVMTLCHETIEQDRLLGDGLIIRPVDCHRKLHYNFVEDSSKFSSSL